MRALCWHGKNDVRVDTVSDPKIQEPTDAIIRITSTAICGSDLHLFDGYQPGMEAGDILRHEPMGIVIECGHCFFCSKTLFSCCETTNPDAEKASKMMGHAPAGLFGFSHLVVGY